MKLAGTEGKSLRVEAVKLKLINLDNYSIKYRVHIQNIGWQEWKYDGQIARNNREITTIRSNWNNDLW